MSADSDRAPFRPSTLFAVLAFAAGIPLAVVTPPLASPDEHRHMAAAFLFSEGHFTASGQAPGAAAWIPRSLAKLDRRMDHSPPFAPPRQFTPAEIIELLRQPLEPANRREAAFLPTYGPVAYASQALGFAAGRALDLSPAGLIYLGRLPNLLCYIAAGCLALRFLPLRSWSLCLLLLMPMPLALAASLSADTATLATSVLFLALVARAAFSKDRRVESADAVALVGLCALTALAKPGYWLVAAAVFAIPGSRFRDARQRAAVCGGTLAAALLPSLAWTLFVMRAEPFLPSPQADPVAQLAFVVENPFAFLRTLVGTLMTSAGLYLRSFVGLLGHVNVPLPAAVYAIYPLALLASTFADGPDPEALTWLRRAALAALFVGGLVCVMTLIYVGGNPVGHRVVVGFQGRYLNPFVPLLLIALPAAHRRLPAPLLAWGVAATATLSLAAAVVAVWTAFYSG